MLVPVGKSRMMKRQEVRGSFTTDLAPLFKTAQAKQMNPNPPQTETKSLDISGDEVPDAQITQPEPQESAEGVGGSFIRPGTNMSGGPETPDQTQEQQDQTQEQLDKANAQKAFQLQKELMQKLRSKGMKRSRATIDSRPGALDISFDTTSKVFLDGKWVLATNALEDVIQWAQGKGIFVNYEDSLDNEEESGGRPIERVDASDRVPFRFTWRPQNVQKQKKQPEVTVMESNGRPNSRMGIAPEDRGQIQAAASTKLLREVPPSLREMQRSDKNGMMLKLSNVQKQDQSMTKKQASAPSTMSEMSEQWKSKMFTKLGSTKGETK